MCCALPGQRLGLVLSRVIMTPDLQILKCFWDKNTENRHAVGVLQSEFSSVLCHDTCNALVASPALSSVMPEQCL